MPRILVAFFIAVGLGTTYDLPGAVAHGVDPRNRLESPGSPAAEYRVWSATASHRPREGCAGTTFALATRGPVRLQVEGEEQVLDTSWRFDWRLAPGEKDEVRYTFLDPVGGAELACRVAYARCEVWGRDTVTRTGWRPCWDADAAAERRWDGDPRLELRAPTNAMTRGMLPGTDGLFWGSFSVVAEILGRPDPDWYCPAVEWRTPVFPGSHDYTSSVVESDCDPYTEAAARQQTRRWSRNFRVVEGEWQITVVISKAGRQIARQSVVVQVGPAAGGFGD